MSDKICPICGKNKITFPWEDMCYSCQREQHEREIKEQIQSGHETETSYEDEIYCPWCGKKLYFEPCYDYELLYAAGDHEAECPECGKPFTVDTSVSYSYSTRRLEKWKD